MFNRIYVSIKPYIQRKFIPHKSTKGNVRSPYYRHLPSHISIPFLIYKVKLSRVCLLTPRPRTDIYIYPGPSLGNFKLPKFSSWNSGKYISDRPCKSTDLSDPPFLEKISECAYELKITLIISNRFSSVDLTAQKISIDHGRSIKTALGI